MKCGRCDPLVHLQVNDTGCGHIHIHVCVCVCIYIYIHIYIHIYLNLFIYIHTHPHIPHLCDARGAVAPGGVVPLPAAEADCAVRKSRRAVERDEELLTKVSGRVQQDSAVLPCSKALALIWYRALTWYSSPARSLAAPDDP